MAVGARLRQRLVTAGLLRKSAYATTKVATGLPVQECRYCGGWIAGRRSFLPWVEDASVHQAKDLAVFGLMAL